MQNIISVWTSIHGKRCRIEIAVIRTSRMSAVEQPPRTWLTIRRHAVLGSTMAEHTNAGSSRPAAR
eukprot:308193-Prymnesium_polylepis.1